MRRTHVAWIVLGAVFCLVASQAALGPSVGGLLRRNLERQATEYREIEVSLSPLGWLDLFSGRVRRVIVQARQVSFGGPRLSLLRMDLSGIRFSPFALFWHGDTTVTGLGAGTVRARIEADALNEYRRLAYPAIPVFFHLQRDRVGLTGSISVLGRDLSLRTVGNLRPSQGERLRFVPEAIEVAGAQIPQSLLASYGESLALEFPVELPLPLTLHRVVLREGYIELHWTERADGGVG